MKEAIKTMLTAMVAVSVFAVAGMATADKPVCLDADGNEMACEKGPRGDAESADGTGIESADGTGVESADGTGTESEADPEGG